MPRSCSFKRSACWATVGCVRKSLRESSTTNLDLSRERVSIASNECPPKPKKFSLRATLLVFKTSAQVAAIISTTMA